MDSNINVFEVFPWNENFRTGCSKIDEQHKVLVSLLNKLSEALITHTEFELNTLLNELASYAKVHFEDEEAIFKESFSNDPWFLEHVNTHNSFLPSVMKIMEQADDEPLVDIIEKMVHFLVQWLMFHIIHSDRRMVLTIKALESGISMEEAKLTAEKEMSGSEKILIDAILHMYSEMSSRTIALMREVGARREAETQLNEANRRLEEKTITDSLTGLFNRRHMDNVFAEKQGKAARDKTELTLLLIDIDFFKNINDHYGHINGDKALRKFGSCLQRHCRRPDDIIFRIGGEEFAIITTNKTEKDAAQFAETLRKATEELKIPNSRSEVSEYMTVSIGVCHTIPGVSDDLDQFARVADRRLYHAKISGRNQIVCSD